MAISDVKARWRIDYWLNWDICQKCLRNDNDMTATYIEARKRNEQIVEQFKRVFSMTAEQVADYLEKGRPQWAKNY